MDAYLTALGFSFAALFPIINPIGHAPMFFVMTQEQTADERRSMTLKIALYVFLILLISLFGGHWVLRFFGITLDDLRIAGGLLVGHAAWGMLNNTARITPHEQTAALEKEDISLTPMATPILAGPGAMSLAIGLAAFGIRPVDYAGYVSGFLAVAAITWISFYFSDAIVGALGANAIGALNRLLGFFIFGIGVGLVVTGAQHAFPGLAH